MSAARSGSDFFELFKLDESYKKGLLHLYKVLAVPSVVAALLIFFDLLEEVNRGIYELLKPGDEVILGLSRVFKEVKAIRVCRDGKYINASAGRDVLYMRVFGIFCLATALPYFVGTRLFSRYFSIIVLASPLLALVSLVLLSKLILVCLGVISRV